MATLADINETLLKQNENLAEIAEDSKETSDSIQSLVRRISEQAEAAERQRLKDTGKKAIQPKVQTGNMMQKMKEKYDESPGGLLSGLLRGLGLGGIAAGGLGIGAFVAGILSKVLGFIGTGIGKFIKTGVLIGAVSAFGEDVINAIFGDSLTDAQKTDMRDALYATATWVGLGGKLITGLLAGVISFLFPETSEKVGGVLVDGFKTALEKIGLPTDWVDKAIGENSEVITQTLGSMAILFAGRFFLLMGGKVGATILKRLFMKAITGAGLIAAFNKVKDGLKLPFGFDDAPDTPPGSSPSGGSADPRGRDYSAQEGAARARQATKLRAKPPKGFKVVETASGPRFQHTEGPKKGKFASLDDVAAIAKKNSKKLARMGKLLGVLGLGFEAYRAYEIINDESLTPKEKIAGVVGVIGSVGGGIIGAALGGLAGSLAFPGVGTLAGGVLGGVLGAMAGDEIMNTAARWALGLPQEELSPGAAAKAEELRKRAAALREQAKSAGDLTTADPMAAYSAMGAEMAARSLEKQANALEMRTTTEVPKVSQNPNDLSSYQKYMTGAPSQSVVSRPSVKASDITEYLMQQDYQEKSQTGGAAAPTQIINNNTNSSSSQGIIMDMGTSNDPLDGGMATGMGNYSKYGYGG